MAAPNRFQFNLLIDEKLDKALTDYRDRYSVPKATLAKILLEEFFDGKLKTSRLQSPKPKP